MASCSFGVYFRCCKSLEKKTTKGIEKTTNQ